MISPHLIAEMAVSSTCDRVNGSRTLNAVEPPDVQRNAFSVWMSWRALCCKSQTWQITKSFIENPF